MYWKRQSGMGLRKNRGSSQLSNEFYQSKMNKVNRVVDKYFDFFKEIGGLFDLKELIPNSMLDNTEECNFEESAIWKPILSTVTDEEINELESYFKHPLPDSYKRFLKHKHFLELNLGGYGVGFFPNIPGELVSKNKEIIEDSYWNLINRNFLPFAHLSDYGVLAFDANVKSAENNYPIVTLSHEDDFEHPDNSAKDFESMFDEFETHLDDWIKRNREQRKVSASTTL